MSSSGVRPSSPTLASLAYVISPVVSMTRVRSDEFCTSDRNRSSLARNRASARSFWSVTAPASLLAFGGGRRRLELQKHFCYISPGMASVLRLLRKAAHLSQTTRTPSQTRHANTQTTRAPSQARHENTREFRGVNWADARLVK